MFIGACYDLLCSCYKDSTDTLLPQKLSSIWSALFALKFHVALCFPVLWQQTMKAEKQESYVRPALLRKEQETWRQINLTASVVLLTVQKFGVQNMVDLRSVGQAR